MGDKIIEKLMIAIGVDSKGVEAGATKAVQSAAGALKSAIGTFIMPVFGALMSGAFIKQTYEEVINLDHLSTSLGVNVERLQMWQGAVKDAGASVESMNMLFQRMSGMIAESAETGSGTLHDFAEKGVLPALKTVDGKVKDTETYLLELSDTLNKMGGQEANMIGRKLGIKDFNLLNFLQQGSGEVNQQLQHIKQLGVYTHEDVLIARDFDVALNDVSRVMKMSLVPLFRLITPLISKLGMALLDVSKHARIFIPLIAGIAAVMLKSMIPAIIQLAGQLKLLLFTNPYILAIGAALLALGLIIEDILVWIEGGDSVIGEFFGDFETFSQNAKQKFEDFCNRATVLWGQFKEAIEPVTDAVLWFIDVLDLLIRALNINKEVSDQAWAEMKNSALNFFKPVTEWVDRLKEKLLSFWNFLKDIPSKLGSIGTGALNINARGAGGNVDNSQKTVTVEQNNHVTVDSTDAAVKYTKGVAPVIDDTAYNW